MRTKQISVKEYASKIDPDYFKTDDRRDGETEERERGTISRQAIKYRIKNGMPLPEVIRYSKIGKVHVLTVRETF